jgi:hypothetical protein
MVEATPHRRANGADEPSATASDAILVTSRTKTARMKRRHTKRRAGCHQAAPA